MGLGPGPETATMTRDYGLLLAGLAARVPVRIPGTTYGRAMTARNRLLTRGDSSSMNAAASASVLCIFPLCRPRSRDQRDLHRLVSGGDQVKSLLETLQRQLMGADAVHRQR